MKRSRESEDGDDTAGYSENENVVIVPVSKIITLDTEDAKPQSNQTIIQCSLPGHPRGSGFTNYAEYERHYAQAHSNRCLECRKNFPTAHILGLHIQEHHDALTEMKRERGEFTVRSPRLCLILGVITEFPTVRLLCGRV